MTNSIDYGTICKNCGDVKYKKVCKKMWEVVYLGTGFVVGFGSGGCFLLWLILRDVD